MTPDYSASVLAATDTEWLSLDQLAAGCEDLCGMVGRSSQIRGVFNAIRRFAPYQAMVLVYGESGTGKELGARALHQLGPSPRGPYVVFNCSNLIESLAESQLFGHVKGAFTDARQDSPGYFRAAQGGTLLLDEIGELPMHLQAKLLRVVETLEVQPVGSNVGQRVDARLVAATNCDLRAMIQAGTFREDLFYRLGATSIEIPPLRLRRDDIGVLIAHLVDRSCRLHGKNVGLVSRALVENLQARSWPGNVRQLAHLIESAMLMTEHDRLDVADLPAEPHWSQEHSPKISPPPQTLTVKPANQALTPISLPVTVDDAMKDCVIRALDQTHGNRRQAAKLVGVSRSTFYRMLSRYGVETRTLVSAQLANQNSVISGTGD